ncbi:MAG: GIY-YIG nuclease family protein [bacterium]|nr:GIY-YIG nuclease family protein [bacterium]
MAFVYILRCADDSLYTGSAKDVDARLEVHNSGRASRYTRSRLPVELVWSREVATWSEALREEHRIKKLSRAEKLRFIGARADIISGTE